MSKPILCLDFDGVIHDYKSGWQGASVISDPPVYGALKFLVGALDHFEVHIYSSRSHQWGGRRAMKKWLKKHLIVAEAGAGPSNWWVKRIYRSSFADPWSEEVAHAADLVVKEIKWPTFKPPALVTIDDRALTFTGPWPEISDLKAFKPWNKKGA